VVDQLEDVSKFAGWRGRRAELQAEWEAGADNLDGDNDVIDPHGEHLELDRLHEHTDADLPGAESRGDRRGAASPATALEHDDRGNDQPESSLVLPRWRSKGSMTRRGYPIHAYIGANGHGKSLAMMHDTWLSIAEGRPILSTVRVLDPRTNEQYAGYTPLRRWSQLLEFRDGDVLFDEVLGIAASEAGKALPKAVQLLLNQLRRRDILLRWTAPSWSRANVVLREVTQAVSMCRGYLPRYQSAGGRHWGMNRLFRWNTYDAMEFTTWSDNKEHNLKGKQNAWAFREVPWWFPGKHGAAELAGASYDTFDAVDNVDSGEGYCFRCGGERPKLVLPACSCPAL
jgi:hypothetical protein